MKGLAIITILLSGFYILSLNMAMGQLKHLEDFYGNIDYYVSQSFNPDQKTPLKPQPLESEAQPLKSLLNEP